jgi:methylamine---glutamate N-methyltransferase subunit B
VDDSHPSDKPADVVLAVPEIRDYHAINSELVRHLDAGCRVIRLAGVRGQRLLASGLYGRWIATIEVDGDAGPEFGAGCDAPGLTIICLGGAADGAASRLSAGNLVVLGDAGVAFGYAQRGGLAVAVGDVAGRAGLCQSRGDLVLLGDAGPMAGERQSGGRLFALAHRIGPHAGRGGRGGRIIRLNVGEVSDRGRPEPNDDIADLLERLNPLRPWLGSVLDSIAGRLTARPHTPGIPGLPQ